MVLDRRSAIGPETVLAFPRDLIEFALAHKLDDKTEAAYRRSTALEKRRKLMEAWAGFLAKPVPAGASITTLHSAAS